ncbi:hypothetical protein Tco_0778854 [Tanacetum coccineum]
MRLKSKASEAGSSALATEQADDAEDANLFENDYCACAYLEDTLERDEGTAPIGVARKGRVEVIRQKMDNHGDRLTRSALA